MKLVVFSDSHGVAKYLDQAMETEKPDYILHLGDYTRDADRLGQRYPMTPLLNVRGNCDYGSDAPEEYVLALGGRKLFLCHGHKYGVKYDLLRVRLAAMERGADACLFGHTHEAVCQWENGILLLNPGPCGGSGMPSYAVIRLENGQMDAEIKYFYSRW